MINPLPFLTHARKILKLKHCELMTREEAAARISGFNRQSLTDKDLFSSDHREIIELAMDLEVPDNIYHGDVNDDWRKLEGKINNLYFSLRPSEKKRLDEKEKRLTDYCIKVFICRREGRINKIEAALAIAYYINSKLTNNRSNFTEKIEKLTNTILELSKDHEHSDEVFISKSYTELEEAVWQFRTE